MTSISSADGPSLINRDSLSLTNSDSEPVRFVARDRVRTSPEIELKPCQ